MTALLYASVGFGGGSTYTALLAMSEVDYRMIPPVSLVCNLVVVSGGVFHAARGGNLRFREALPLLVTSVPLAFLGGLAPISETLFLGLLTLALLIAGARLVTEKKAVEGEERQKLGWATMGAIGGGLGFLSGLIGIGGGIFLAPVLYLLKWNSPRVIAGTASLFILVNSLSGLAGQATKLARESLLADCLPFWPLAVAVLIGGQLGSLFSTKKLPPLLIQKLTGVLILAVALRLAARLLLSAS